ncbi:cation diffusion facilitator family transporter [Poseidonocella pacifica]|nr:cation diffusion facilitator family transporter [Poseidonocella pacifica]
MPHDHSHDHIEEAGDRRVALAILVNLALTVAQIIGGVFAGSLALIADAIHNLSDALSLVIAFFARRISRRPANADMTFGYGRAEVVAALVNYTTLIVIALYLMAEGVQRLLSPSEVEGWTVVIVAGIALIVDAVTALLIFGMSKSSMNMRAAFLHNLTDAMASVAVIVSGIAVLLYDWRLVDPLVTLGISGYILWHAAMGLKPVIRVLMLAAPEDVDLADVIADLEAVNGVESLHHVHLWHMGEKDISLQAHVVTSSPEGAHSMKRDLRAILEERHGITHSVLELETAPDVCADARVVGH